MRLFRKHSSKEHTIWINHFFLLTLEEEKKIECAQFIQIHCISFEHSAGRRTRRLISDTAFGCVQTIQLVVTCYNINLLKLHES